MKPILAIALFTLVCITHRIQFANASHHLFPLVNLERLSLVKRGSPKVNYVDDDGNMSGTGGGSISSDGSSGGPSETSSEGSSESSSGTSDSGSTESSETSQPPPGKGMSTSPPSTTSNPDSSTPCDDAETSSSPPPPGTTAGKETKGIITSVTDETKSLTSQAYTGIKNKVMQTGATLSEGIHEFGDGVESVANGAYQITKATVKTPYNLLNDFCLTPECMFDLVLSAGKSIWNFFVGSTIPSLSISRRSIRSTMELTRPIMVSPYENLMQTIEVLVRKIANAPAKERARYLQILQTAQCNLGEWFGFGTCTGVDTIPIPGLNKPISWQIGLENILSWTKDHLKYLSDYDIMPKERVDYLTMLCQMLRTVLHFLIVMEGN